MKFLRHKEIDKVKWDSLVKDSIQPSLYMLSWYLDAASPKWDAVIWGDYEAILPLPTKRWWWFRKVYQPFFVQQTGVQWKEGFDGQSAINELFGSEIVNKYFSFRTHFNSLVQIPNQELLHGKWQLETKKNYVLPLILDYSLISKGYNENRKRNIKKAKALGWEVSASEDIGAAIQMYKQNQAPNQKGLNEEVYVVLERIFAKCAIKEVGELLACTDSEGTKVSYAFFVHNSGRIYYLFGTMNARGREHSAISLLFDNVIERNAGNQVILDFEGGNMESIGNYFASFGALEEEYNCLWR